MTYGDRVLERCINICVSQQYVATTRSPQHALKRRQTIAQYHTGHKPAYITCHTVRQYHMSHSATTSSPQHALKCRQTIAQYHTGHKPAYIACHTVKQHHMSHSAATSHVTQCNNITCRTVQQHHMSHSAKTSSLLNFQLSVT